MRGSAGGVTESESRRYRSRPIYPLMYWSFSVPQWPPVCRRRVPGTVWRSGWWENKKPFNHPLPPVVRGTETPRKSPHERGVSFCLLGGDGPIRQTPAPSARGGACAEAQAGWPKASLDGTGHNRL